MLMFELHNHDDDHQHDQTHEALCMSEATCIRDNYTSILHCIIEVTQCPSYYVLEVAQTPYLIYNQHLARKLIVTLCQMQSKCCSRCIKENKTY